MDSRGMTSTRLLVLLTVAVVFQPSPSAALRDRSLDDGFPLKNKRPFCNAFTGCGRKRSGGGGEAEPTNDMDVKDQIDEVARHVLGQDRMLEQLQQKVELMRALACGYPEIPAQSLYRRRRDVQELTPSATGFHGYIATPKRRDPADRVQTTTSSSSSYYYASEQHPNQQREIQHKNQSPNAHGEASGKSRRPNQSSAEEDASFDDRNGGTHGGKGGRNKSVSDQE